MQVCGAAFVVLHTYDGSSFRTAATRGVPDEYARYRRDNPPAYGPGTGLGALRPFAFKAFLGRALACLLPTRERFFIASTRTLTTGIVAGHSSKPQCVVGVAESTL
jgi:hypothetical protein